MATVAITCSVAMDGIKPVFGAQPEWTETITSSGTSQRTTETAKPGAVINVTASGGAVWVKIGASATASAGNDWLVTNGASMQFGHLQAGWTVAVIDA